MAITENLPWLVIWVVVLLLQSFFLRRKNFFASLLILWFTLLVSIFWNTALSALLPGVASMWLFGTKIWVLFLIIAVRHYLNQRKEKKALSPKGEDHAAKEAEPVSDDAAAPDDNAPADETDPDETP